MSEGVRVQAADEVVLEVKLPQPSQVVQFSKLDGGDAVE